MLEPSRGHVKKSIARDQYYMIIKEHLNYNYNRLRVNCFCVIQCVNLILMDGPILVCRDKKSSQVTEFAVEIITEYLFKFMTIFLRLVCKCTTN